MTNPAVEYRYATEQDLTDYYGEDDGVYYSTRAVVIAKHGKIVGVGGVSRVENKMVVFTNIEDGKVSKRDIIEAGKLLIPIIKRYTSVIAFLDEESKTAVSFGKHFGFYKTGASTEEGQVLMRVNK